jgi:uncharacterized Fe-S cluster protein YjdI
MTDDAAREPRHEPTTERVYSNDQIEVLWEPALCIHVAECIRGSARAFDPQRRPWVDVNAESPERLAQIIERCPTGALHARWLDGRPSETPPEPAEIEASHNGPLFVHGSVRILDRHGSVVREDTRLALCRCGSSQNKPFCDDSHYRIGFQDGT